MTQKLRQRGSRRALAAVFAMAVLTPAVVAFGPRESDAVVTPRVDVGDAAVWEGNSGAARALSFPVTLSSPAASTVTVSFHLMAGTAAAPADFNDLRGVTKTLSFTAGSAQVRFVNVRITPDVADEANETFTLMVLGVAGGATEGDSTATGTILDDDPGSGVKIGVSDVSVSEGDSGKNGVAKFWVSLTQPALTTVTVRAATMDAGTTAGTDYLAKAGTVSFAPGQVTKPFAVTIKPDTNYEASTEEFHVMLSEAVGGTIIGDTGIGTITDDDTGELTTQTFLVGPFTMNRLGLSGSENEASSTVPRPAGSFAIKQMAFDLVDTSGNSVNMHDVHLHHIVMFDPSRTDAVCPYYMSRFGGAGKELTTKVLGDNYAYLVEGTDPAWQASWHLMNMSAQTKTVYIKYTIGYVAYNHPSAARSVTPYWYDVTGPCTASEYNVPGNGGASGIHSKSYTFTAPKNGVRVFVPGHLHDGAIDITLKRTASNQVICTNVAEYPMPDMLHSISSCTNPTTVTAGEQFTTTARYRNNAFVEGAMGIQLTYVWEP